MGSSWHDFGGFGRLDLRKDEPTGQLFRSKNKGSVFGLVFFSRGNLAWLPEGRGRQWIEVGGVVAERQESLAEGGAFVDYTAKWCQSCQFNKRVYESAEVIDQFNELDVVPLKAD